MGKKEKKSNLEWLLNSLIEKGWKPFGRNSNKAYYRPEWPDEFYFGENWYGYIYNWRQIVSKESWLWQFVCENRMVEHRNYWIDTEIWQDEQYKYRLIESALCDEDKLEEFLLNSIKLD
jgi:hypothetical protein